MLGRFFKLTTNDLLQAAPLLIKKWIFVLSFVNPQPTTAVANFHRAQFAKL